MRNKIFLFILFLLIPSLCFGAVDFDGSSDCLQSASTVSFSTNIITVSFWMNWDTYADDDDIAFELTEAFWVGGNGPSFIFLPNSSADGGGKVSLLIHDGSGNYRQEVFTRPSADTWHHYAIIFDNTTNAGDIKFYVDGSEDTGSVLTSGNGIANFISGETLNIMSRNCSSLHGDGALSEFYIYDNALTQAEISLLSDAKTKRVGLQVDGLILYLPLDECGDGTACTTASMFKDMSGNGNHFSPSNSPTGQAGEVLTYP